MHDNELELILIPSKDDAPLESKKYQTELIEFSKQLSKNSPTRSIMFAMDSIGGGGGLYGQFILALAPSVISGIVVAARWWLSTKAGRRIRLKVGNVEAEANNLNELDAMLERAKMMQEFQAKLEQES